MVSSNGKAVPAVAATEADEGIRADIKNLEGELREAEAIVKKYPGNSAGLALKACAEKRLEAARRSWRETKSPADQLRDKSNKLSKCTADIRKLQERLRDELLEAQRHEDRADEIRETHRRKKLEEKQILEEMQELQVDVNGMLATRPPPPPLPQAALSPDAMEALIQHLRASFGAIATATLANTEATEERDIVDKLLADAQEKLLLISTRGKGLEDKAEEARRKQLQEQQHQLELQKQRTEEDAAVVAAKAADDVEARRQALLADNGLSQLPPQGPTQDGGLSQSGIPAAQGTPCSQYGPSTGRKGRKRVEEQSFEEMLNPAKAHCLPSQGDLDRETGDMVA